MTTAVGSRRIRQKTLCMWPLQVVAVKFVEVLCHEMVHVMQTVCERDVKETYGVLHDGADEGESYFFDPYEIEARLLESFYAHSFGKNLITSSMEETK